MIRIDKEFVYLDKGATLLPFKTSIIILLIKVNPLYPLFGNSTQRKSFKFISIANLLEKLCITTCFSSKDWGIF